MTNRSSVRILTIRMLLPIIVVFAILGVGVILLARPTVAHAAIDPACLGVQARILPSKDTLPFTEVLSITVTNGCGETVNLATLTIADHIRCGTDPWVIDYTTSTPPATSVAGGSLF